jgi:uncharacterized membrane protein
VLDKPLDEGAAWRYMLVMGQASETKLRNLASALICMGVLVSCGDAEITTVRYDSVDKTLAMDRPKLAAREKCYGISRAQFNDCAAGAGTHCAGTADADYMPDRWQYVTTGTCEKQGGALTPAAVPYISEK